MPGVYTTNVDGIGIELLNSSGQIVRGKGYSCDTTATPIGTVSSDSGQTFSFSYTQRLIKTASHIGSGTLSLAQDPYGFGVLTLWGFLVHVIPATIPPRSAKERRPVLLIR